MTTVLKCNSCGHDQVRVTNNGNVTSYQCLNSKCLSAAITVGALHNGEPALPKEFSAVETPSMTGQSALKTKRLNPNVFWDQYIKEHVPEFYPGGKYFVPKAFQMHIEMGKSYLIADGVQSDRMPDGSYENHKDVTETKRFPEDIWAIAFWNELVDNFGLPLDANRAHIECKEGDDEVEIKVAVTLRQSFERASNRTVTKAEADMLKGQVINSTPSNNPTKKDIISYVGVGLSDPNLFLGPNGTQVSNIKRAQHFATESACRSSIQAHNKNYMFRVREVIE